MFNQSLIDYPVYNYEPKRYSIQGKRASKNEWYLSQAFDFYGLTYIFQVEYYGGRKVLGGQILDFLLFTPRETRVQVFGDYWHEGQLGDRDRYNLIVLEQTFGTPVVIFYSDDTNNLEAAKQSVIRKII